MTCLPLACLPLVSKEEIGKALSLQCMMMVWEMALAIHTHLLHDGSAETRWTAEEMRVVGHTHLAIKGAHLAMKEECSHHFLVLMIIVDHLHSDELKLVYRHLVDFGLHSCLLLPALLFHLLLFNCVASLLCTCCCHHLYIYRLRKVMKKACTCV